MVLNIIFFTVFAIVAVFSAIALITRTNPVFSAMYLILNFFSFAVLFLLLNAQFIAILQILVYAGAIMVLFVFVIMLLNLGNEERHPEKFNIRKLIAVVIAFALFAQFALLFLVVGKNYLNIQQSANSMDAGTIKAIGKALFTNYLVPFELASVLLLVAIVGVIILAKRRLE